MLKAFFDLVLVISACVSTCGAVLVTEDAWHQGFSTRLLLVIVWLALSCVWGSLVQVIRIDPSDLQ